MMDGIPAENLIYLKDEIKVKDFIVFNFRATKTYKGMKAGLHAFLTWTLDVSG
jgi:hypothetical protein